MQIVTLSGKQYDTGPSPRTNQSTVESTIPCGRRIEQLREDHNHRRAERRGKDNRLARVLCHAKRGAQTFFNAL